MTYIKVEGYDGLARDERSGAIVNINPDMYVNAVSAAKKRKEKEQLMSSLQTDVSELKSDMSTIKNLLLQLVGENHDN